MAQNIPDDVLKLIDIYVKAQDNLVKTISEKEALGNVTTYQKGLLLQVRQILYDLDVKTKQWSNDAITEHYRQGIDEAIKGLEALGVKDNTVDFNQIHQGAIEAIVFSCYQDLHDANNYLGRRIQDAIRTAGIDAVTNKIATGQTVKECKNNLVKSLISEGVSSVKDKRGRNISLDAYASLVARTTTREATNTATMNQLTGSGYDLVKMSSHPTTCRICSVYQGRVYSISGKSTEYPPLQTAFSGEHANIHPNCKHSLMPYMSEYDDDAQKTKSESNRSFDVAENDQKAIDDYNKQQVEKAKLRRDREQYNRYRLAMPDDAPKSFANFRQIKNANSVKFVDLQSKYKSIRQGGNA